MEPLLVLAAFSFNLCCQPVQLSVHELDFRPPTGCSASEVTKINPAKAEEKITLVTHQPVPAPKHSANKRLAELSSKFSPSINLNNVSWMNSSLTEYYDPQLSVRVRRAELSGFEALLQVSIPL